MDVQPPLTYKQLNDFISSLFTDAEKWKNNLIRAEPPYKLGITMHSSIYDMRNAGWTITENGDQYPTIHITDDTIVCNKMIHIGRKNHLRACSWIRATQPEKLSHELYRFTCLQNSLNLWKNSRDRNISALAGLIHVKPQLSYDIINKIGQKMNPPIMLFKHCNELL